MKRIITVGPDLAKNVFPAHGADAGAICETSRRPGAGRSAPAD